MEDGEGEIAPSSFLQNAFRSFVCLCLTLLLGIHMYTYWWDHPLSDVIDGDFSDVKQVLMQLSKGLTEVNRKHEHLQGEMQRLSETLPAVTAAAHRARDALEPSRRATHHTAELADYDRQVVDYALESAGGRVVDTGDTADYLVYESMVGWALHAVTSLVCRECLGSRALLRPGSLPGQCWAFRGQVGEATIRLLGTIFVTGVSLEHIPAHIAPTREISSAPRVFQIQGLESRYDQHPHDFGTFEYAKEGKPIQYFEVVNPSNRPYSLVRFRVSSNWGHGVYTCVYRVRVHGELAAARRHALHADDGDTRLDNE